MTDRKFTFTVFTIIALCIVVLWYADKDCSRRGGRMETVGYYTQISGKTSFPVPIHECKVPSNDR